MKCERCGNEKAEWFYNGKRGWYCRECVRFKAQACMEHEIHDIDSDYTLKFSLSESQNQISELLNQKVLSGKSVLLEAVCGAGKTELVCKTISEQLKIGKKVGFAIPRRQVVIEIAERMKSIFKSLKVTAVCQGHTSELDGDLIICTTHQLYRYYKYFDLLIIDEPDAFPFKGNIVLKGIAVNACVGQTVYLTATPGDDLLLAVKRKELDYLYLPKRPSGKPLIVPKALYAPSFVLIFLCLFYIYKLTKKNKPLMLFVPSIELGKRLQCIFGMLFRTCLITSKTDNKDKLIEGFRKRNYKLAVVTTVLERGVTIKGTNVIVMNADHEIFDQSSLVQIAGRVGRDVKDPTGECILLARGRSEEIDNCIERIRIANNE